MRFVMTYVWRFGNPASPARGMQQRALASVQHKQAMPGATVNGLARLLHVLHDRNGHAQVLSYTRGDCGRRHLHGEIEGAVTQGGVVAAGTHRQAAAQVHDPRQVSRLPFGA